MNNPGTYTLTAAVTAAGTQTTARSSDITDLDGIVGLTAEFQFIAGTGGATCKAYLRQTFDQGVTYQDIACASFTTTNGTKAFNISGLTPKTSAVDVTATAADDTAVDGFLGGDLQLKVVSTGTYVGAQVICRVAAR